MSTLSIVLLVILVVLIIACVVLYFLGKKAEKKQAEQQEQLDAVAQTVSMLIIDKGKMKLKDSGLPQIVIDNTPKYLRRSKVPVVKARRLTLTARFLPLFKAAAVVAVVLSLGNVMQHSFFSDVKEVAAADTIGKQISAPSVALSGDASVAHEKQIIDSLRRVDKEQEIKE